MERGWDGQERNTDEKEKKEKGTRMTRIERITRKKNDHGLNGWSRLRSTTGICCSN